MSNYEGKLGEWLKYVQQAISGDNQSIKEETPKPEVDTNQLGETSERMVMRNRLDHVIPDDPSSIDTSSIIADPSLIKDRLDVHNRRAKLFDDADVPDVEDYLPFLKESQQKPESPSNHSQTPPPPVIPPRSERIAERIIESESPFSDEFPFFEGTGEPKPIVRNPEQPVTEHTPIAQAAPTVEPIPVVEPKPVIESINVEEAPESVQSSTKTETSQRQTASKPRTKIIPPAQPDAAEIRELWDKLPRHIQLLMGQSQQEVAQRSYKKFKETREELVAKLLDPTLSLEETARILNVCPTTVRRYTNRGALKHLRTAGNQRRFRLSDVLGFLESHQVGIDSDSTAETAQ
jgi:excisionase family DNA binding protein